MRWYEDNPHHGHTLAKPIAGVQQTTAVSLDDDSVNEGNVRELFNLNATVIVSAEIASRVKKLLVASEWDDEPDISGERSL